MSERIDGDTALAPGPVTRRASRGRRWLLRCARVLLVVVLAWWVVLYFAQRELLFPRGLARTMTEDKIPSRIERVWIDIEDGGRVEGWFVAADGASAASPAPVMIYFHGNAESIDQNVRWAKRGDGYPARGFHVMLVEYRGFGRSSGRPSEAGIVADGVRFVEWALARTDVRHDGLVLHGRSLGTGVATQVAARLPVELRPRAMILDSPFTSVSDFAWRYGAPKFVVRDRFDTIGTLPGLTARREGEGGREIPVLIYHSREDEIVPFSHGKALAAATSSAELLELRGSHLEEFAFESQGGVVWTAIDRTLERAGLSAEARPPN